MLIVKRKKYILAFEEKWFAKSIKYIDIIKPVVYRQAIIQKPIGFITKKFHTLLINLNIGMDEIFSTFNSNYRNEIRRAESENFTFNVGNSDEIYNSFYTSYNNFAIKMQIPLISIERLRSIEKNSILTKSCLNNKVVNYHLYLVTEKRARLMYSIDTCDDEIPRKYYGWGNKYLHYCDIKYFINTNLNEYDFGGYAINTQDAHLAGINKFKKGFGGIVTQENHYESIVLFLLKLLVRYQ